MPSESTKRWWLTLEYRGLSFSESHLSAEIGSWDHYCLYFQIGVDFAMAGESPVVDERFGQESRAAEDTWATVAGDCAFLMGL